MKDTLERLILYLENELTIAERDELEEELKRDESLRRELAELRRTVQIVSEHQPEEPGQEYFSNFYSRLQPKLTQPFEGLGRLGLAGGLSVMMLAFIAVALGINYLVLQPEEIPSVRSETVNIKRSEGFLEHVAQRHLEKSELLLREVTNIVYEGADNKDLLVAASQRGDELLSANRTYRQAAKARGNDDLVQLLEDLEAVLIEISNMDPDAAEYALPSLKRAIRKKNLLIKIEIINLNDVEQQTSFEQREVV
jgi:hypothetical protein